MGSSAQPWHSCLPNYSFRISPVWHGNPSTPCRKSARRMATPSGQPAITQTPPIPRPSERRQQCTRATTDATSVRCYTGPTSTPTGWSRLSASTLRVGLDTATRSGWTPRTSAHGTASHGSRHTPRLFPSPSPHGRAGLRLHPTHGSHGTDEEAPSTGAIKFPIGILNHKGVILWPSQCDRWTRMALSCRV